MSRWTCPRCDREFANPRQAHTCVPGTTVDRVFTGRVAWQRAIFDALLDHLETLGPVHCDPVSVGVFLKREQKFAEARPQTRSLSLELVLPRQLPDARVAKHIRVSASRVVHVVKLTEAAQVDAQLRAWLTESYDAAG